MSYHVYTIIVHINIQGKHGKLPCILHLHADNLKIVNTPNFSTETSV